MRRRRTCSDPRCGDPGRMHFRRGQLMTSFLRQRPIALSAALVLPLLLAACAKEERPLKPTTAPAAATAAAGPYESGMAAFQRRDYARAAELWRPAADSGDLRARNELGRLYLDGRGVPKDEKRAAEYFHSAAEQGDAAAQCALGSLYLQGRGVPQDNAEAWRWIRRSAEQRLPLGQYYLGWLYQYGAGAPRNIIEADNWYRLAADQRESRAQLALGRMHQLGNGPPQDNVLAYAWYTLAMSDPQAVPETKRVAQQWRTELAMRMQTASIARAEKLASTWKPGAM